MVITRRKWQDIRKYDWIDWSDYFFKDAHFKAIIIMKLCNNNEKYNEFTAMYKSRIFDAIQSNDLIPFYENLLKVMNYLDSGEYKKSTVINLCNSIML
jgi:hypothetical protein